MRCAPSALASSKRGDRCRSTPMCSLTPSGSSSASSVPSRTSSGRTRSGRSPRLLPEAGPSVVVWPRRFGTAPRCSTTAARRRLAPWGSCWSRCVLPVLDVSRPLGAPAAPSRCGPCTDGVRTGTAASAGRPENPAPPAVRSAGSARSTATGGRSAPIARPRRTTPSMPFAG